MEKFQLHIGVMNISYFQKTWQYFDFQDISWEQIFVNFAIFVKTTKKILPNLLKLVPAKVSGSPHEGFQAFPGRLI